MPAVISLYRANADGSVKKGYALSGVSAVKSGSDFTVAVAAVPFDPAAGDVVNVHGDPEAVRVVTAVSGGGGEPWVLTAGGA